MKELEKDYGGITKDYERPTRDYEGLRRNREGLRGITMELGLYDLKSKTWEDYGISKARRKELQAFCWQYREKLDEIKYGPNPIIYDDMPHVPGGGDPTGIQAARNVRLRKDCEMIELAAMEASATLYPHIIAYVTDDESPMESIPIRKPEFYGLIRYFFHILDLKKRRRD